MLYNMIEMITGKESQQDATKLLTVLLEGSINKIEAMALVLEEVFGKLERTSKKSDPESEDVETTPIDIALIEKARPVASATYAVEKHEDLVTGEY